MRLDAGSRFATLASEGPYSWLEGYRERLEGKEARAEYYVLLEAAELPSLARQPERMSSSGWGPHLRV